MRKIFLPPELYEGIKDLTLEKKGMLIDYFYKYNLGIDFEIAEDLKIHFNYFRIFFDSDILKYDEFCKSRQENGKKGGRPIKDFKNSQKPKKAKKPIEEKRRDNNNNIIYIKNKEDIKSLLTEDEINDNLQALKILLIMIDMGLKIENDKKQLLNDVEWIKNLIKQYIPLKESGLLNYQEAFKIVDGWVDYWKNPPKGKKYPTNFKNSLRTSFSIMTK